MTKWTTKQQLALANYTGNLTDACRKAGYSHPKVAASRLLTNVNFAKEIRNIDDGLVNRAIANRQQRKEFYTAVMNDEKQTMTSRLRAAELLSKSEGDFIEHRVIEDRRKRGPTFIDIAVEYYKRNPPVHVQPLEGESSDVREGSLQLEAGAGADETTDPGTEGS